MGVFTNIEAALNTKLSTLGTPPPIDWPNTNYVPVIGTLFLRPTMLPASGALATLGGAYEHKGLYQIDIFCPINTGVATLTSWMDAIQALFAGTKSLTAGSDKVYIQDVAQGKGLRDQAWYQGIVTVTYVCLS